MNDQWTAERLLGHDGEDPGCDECLNQLHVWVEGVSRGESGESAQPLVAAHLRNCRACAEDAEGLLALSGMAFRW